MLTTNISTAPVLKGTIKRFSEVGPYYQIGEAMEPLENGDWLYEITILESGEKAGYRLSHIKDDPKAV